MPTSVLGIDIAKESFEAALLTSGRTVTGSFPNSQAGFRRLLRWLTKHKAGELHACLEATGRYYEGLAHFLHEAGCQVSVVNPLRISNYAKSQLSRNKTDKLDAELIARFCQREEPPLWLPRAAEIRELQALTRHLEALLESRTQESNRSSETNPSAAVRKLMRKHVAFLNRQIEQLEREIEEHIERYPDLKHKSDLLTSIKGIGKATAAKLLGENLQRFSDGRALAAYAGLSPRLKESGSSVRGRARLSKLGNPNLRKSLYWPAITAGRFNPVIASFRERLLERGKPNMVVIAACMRKLLCLALGVLKSDRPFDPNYAHTSLAPA